ncbi:TPA: hypothetical protein MIV70_06290 [Klebsiella pneumoniae]|uniref:hypothetical protein n=1 Tax=Klebsiella pneumoniae TaxID=573 RepID=UPI000E2B4B41|nr:hypothetical protein [Klebsiella pneumoniae]SWS56717.1 phage EaA protein [Klebsiella pneumoniae]SWS67472.1 phage EaA protein [Klebsiella pneumoniae]SWT02519.1 phage EaA protein [Klebsiella pneumoniae]HBV9325492.1 hypothetical protein [Klebsiella pneumoniae]HBY4978329.1 hypothetical protein [Klebsiella pneumoniae]
MTTDITELAQREKFEAWWEREYKHLESSKHTDAVPHIKYGFWMAYQAGGAELVEAVEKAQQVDEELCKLLPPGAEYMDPPDGGDVTPLEGVRRMVADYRQRIAELREWNAGLAQESFERQQRISELLEGKVGNALLERENHHVEVVGKLAERITELDSEVEKWKQECEAWEQVAEKQLATAIELESRTVTVKLPSIDDEIFWGYGAHFDSEEYERRLVEVLSAAGIKVEAE